MNPLVKRVGALAAGIAACAFAIAAYLYVASEAMIERRYPLPPTGGLAAPLPNMIARGAHLSRIAGCSDCHGASLEGRPVNAADVLLLWSSNLRTAASELPDADFERALRRGISRDGTSLWGMPSVDYQYLSEFDVAALLSTLQSLGPGGPDRPRPLWDMRSRLALIEGRITPSVLEVRDAPPSLDLGPRYDGGRYLARITCSECHGTDLEGSGDQHAPDLEAVVRYGRPSFFDLLRRGFGADHRRVPVMKRLAAVRFHGFADYEIVALYDYLGARAQAPAQLVARARANQARRRAQNASENQD